MEQRVFEVRQVRSFDQVLSATFTFIRILLKPLFRSLVTIAGPFLLVGGIIYGFVYGDILTLAATAGNPTAYNNAFSDVAGFVVQIIVASILIIAAGLLLFTAINSFIILYTDRGVPPTPAETWQRTRQSLGLVIGTGFMLGLISVVVFGVTAVIAATLGDAGPIVFILLMFLLFPLFIYLAVNLSPIFFVRMQEPIGLFEAINRCFSLIRGYWWQTFGILLIIYILTTVIGYTFAIPQFMLIGIQAATAGKSDIMWSVLTIALTAITFIISQFASSVLFNVSIALQYYSLVERKEALGLRNRVQELEQPAPPEGAV